MYPTSNLLKESTCSVDMRLLPDVGDVKSPSILKQTSTLTQRHLFHALSSKDTKRKGIIKIKKRSYDVERGLQGKRRRIGGRRCTEFYLTKTTPILYRLHVNTKTAVILFLALLTFIRLRSSRSQLGQRHQVQRILEIRPARENSEGHRS
jgi:hypothetical protein